MISRETIAKIRLDYRKGATPAAIGMNRGVCEKTVKKILMGGVLELKYERKPERQPFPRLGAYRERLQKMLEEDQLQPSAKRRPWTRLHEELQAQGYIGGEAKGSGGKGVRH